MDITALRVSGLDVRLLADKAASAAVYAPMRAQEAAEVFALLAEPRPALIAIDGLDWNHDLSPWLAKAVFKGEADFAGGADAFLRRLEDEIVPAAEAVCGKPALRALAGYSLGGLFALWASCRRGLFQAAATVSGSLWYDGFTQWLAEREYVPRAAYFSVGDREKQTKNSRMALVERRTAEAEALCRRMGAKTELELNPGGHFKDVALRTARGINRLLSL